MNDYQTNLSTVTKILAENLQIKESEITAEKELVADLGINSLELADLIMLCEEKFGIEVDDTKMSKFITLDDFIKYLTEI